MITKETVSKTFAFSGEEKMFIDSVLRDKMEKKLIRRVFDNPHYFVPLLSAYGKILGVNPGNGSYVDNIRFTNDEHRILCDVLLEASENPEYTKEFRERAEKLEVELREINF